MCIYTQRKEDHQNVCFFVVQEIVLIAQSQVNPMLPNTVSLRASARSFEKKGRKRCELDSSQMRKERFLKADTKYVRSVWNPASAHCLSIPAILHHIDDRVFLTDAQSVSSRAKKVGECCSSILVSLSPRYPISSDIRNSYCFWKIPPPSKLSS